MNKPLKLNFLKSTNAKFVGMAPHRLSVNLTDFINNNAEVDMPDKAYLWLLYSVSRAIGSRISMTPDESLFTFNATVKGTDSVLSILDNLEDTVFTPKPASLDKEIILVLAANVQPMASLVIQLIGCMQVKPLKQQNLKGFHASMGILQPFNQELTALLYVSSMTDNIAPTDEFTEMRKEIKFLAYHSSATSTPSLILEAYESMPPYFAKLIPDEDIEICRSAMDRPYSLEASNGITYRAIGVTYIWFESTGQDRGGDKWYQGKRAAESLPVHYANRVRAAMKLYVSSQRITNPEDTPESIVSGLL